jgi:hypothetical protein
METKTKVPPVAPSAEYHSESTMLDLTIAIDNLCPNRQAAARTELAALREAKREMGAVLRQVEWVTEYGQDEDSCPHCHQWHHAGHSKDCELAAALAKWGGA